MAKRSCVMAAIGALSLAFGAYAQAAPGKVGVISVQGAIVGTKDGQKAAAALEQKFQPKRKDIEGRQTEVTQMEDQMRKGGNLLTDEKRAQLARDIDEKRKRLNRDLQDAQEEFDQEQQKLLQGLGQRMMAVIEKYSKDNGYSMVLDVSNPNTPVLYASSAIDITQDVISLYDKTSTGGGPATPPTGSAAAPTPPAATPKPPATTAAKPPSPGTTPK
jgi:outer membrane protein